MEQDQRRLFRSLFWFPRSLTARTVGVYASGALWACGYCAFLDCLLYSVYNNGSNVHVSFVDWIPIICTTFGMLLVTAIDKNRILESSLGGTSFMSSSQRTWQAQSLLFCGLALLGFGLSGSFALLLLKYIEPRNVTSTVAIMGWHNLLANFLVMTSCALLWVAQSVEDEYNYSLTL